MFKSDWAFGYGEYWKQFFCRHKNIETYQCLGVTYELGTIKAGETKNVPLIPIRDTKGAPIVETPHIKVITECSRCHIRLKVEKEILPVSKRPSFLF